MASFSRVAKAMAKAMAKAKSKAKSKVKAIVKAKAKAKSNIMLEDIADQNKSRGLEMPFGQLPVLEVDGKQLPQSFAINRYLARKFGLAGKDDFEQAQVDAFGDSIKDFLHEIMPFILVVAGHAEGDKDALYKEKFVPAAEKYFPLYKKYLKEAEYGFLFKSGVTWVDFYLAEFNFTLNNLIPDFFTSHPEFKQHVDKVHALSQLQNYLKSRPETKH
uniref:glutathione transferase n=1 Tax=Acrobeloides nanus TaxID=290746 RepID=A0A914CN23_9BILA